MRRIWTRLALAALLAALLTPAARADAVTDDLKAIKAQLAEINSKLTELGTTQIQVQKNAQEILDLRRRVQQLEEALARISTPTRRAMAFTPGATPAPGDTVAVPGIIRVQNRSAYDATVSINGRPYAIPASETRDIAGVPTGTFTYEVSASPFGIIQPPVARVLNARERYVISINP